MNYIEWPSDFVSSTFAIMGGLVEDFTEPITMILGVLIFAVVMKILMKF